MLGTTDKGMEKKIMYIITLLYIYTYPSSVDILNSAQWLLHLKKDIMRHGKKFTEHKLGQSKVWNTFCRKNS